MYLKGHFYIKTAMVFSLFLAQKRAFSQATIAEADSISYVFYLQKDWKGLIQFSEKAKQKGFDFYFLNARTGVAQYEKGQMQAAEKYFRVALSQLPDDEFSIIYLYWIYTLTGQDLEAATMCRALSPLARKNLSNRPRRLLQSLLLEVGERKSNNSDTVKAFQYKSVGLSHRFSPRFELSYAISHQKQDFFWGGFEQKQYYFSPTINFKKGWKINLGSNFFNFKNQFDYALADNIYKDTTTTKVGNFTRKDIYNGNYGANFNGKFDLKATYQNLALSKSYYGFNASVQYAYYREKTKLNYTQNVDSLVIKQIVLNGNLNKTDTLRGVETLNIAQDSAAILHQIGFNLSKTIWFEKGNALTLGSELHWTFQHGRTYINPVPYVSLLIKNRFSLTAFYLQKGSYPLSMFNGALVLNNYDTYHHRLNITSRYDFNRHFSAFLTYQAEDISDDFLVGRYKMQGLIGSLRVNF